MTKRCNDDLDGDDYMKPDDVQNFESQTGFTSDVRIASGAGTYT